MEEVWEYLGIGGGKMLRIAIVEDNDTDREIITDALGRFETEENEHFSITEFHDAMDFSGTAENGLPDGIYGHSDAVHGRA